jgi:transposase
VLGATYGWYWAADALAAAGAAVHLAHPLGVMRFPYLRVKNDVRDAASLAGASSRAAADRLTAPTPTTNNVDL